MVLHRGIILRRVIQFSVVLAAFFLSLNSSISSISSVNVINNSNQQQLVTQSTAAAPHCPPNLELSCTDEWILDGLESMRIHGIDMAAFKQSNGTFTKKSTEMKLCHFSNESQHAMNYKFNKDGSSMLLAGHTLPTGGVLLKCNNALVEFRTKRQMKGGKLPTVTCGHPMMNNGTNVISYNVSAVLGSDIKMPWLYQHSVKDGLGLSAMIWNHIKNVSNLHVLVGNFKAPWYHLVGDEHVINAPAEQISNGGTLWFRHLYIGTVPSEITPSEWLPQPMKDTMSSIQNSESNLLPCSLSSMDGFQKWRAEFSSSSNEGLQSNNTNNTLLYLQRLGRSGTYRMGNFVFFDCSDSGVVAASCNCTAISEDDFIQRLDAFSRHLGLTLEVFRSDNRLKEDAETFAKAKVVLGPHGEMYESIPYFLASTF